MSIMRQIVFTPCEGKGNLESSRKPTKLVIICCLHFNIVKGPGLEFSDRRRWNTKNFVSETSWLDGRFFRFSVRRLRWTSPGVRCTFSQDDSNRKVGSGNSVVFTFDSTEPQPTLLLSVVYLCQLCCASPS